METAQTLTPFHTQGINGKEQARTHFLGGRQIDSFKGTRFEGVTTHQDHFTQKELPGRLLHQPPPPRANQPFKGQSTYTDTYKAHAISAQKPVVPPRQAYDTGRFDAKTTYVSDYPGHQPSARPPAPAPMSRPQLKFDATSHYHDEYPAKSPEPRDMGKLKMEERPRIPFDAHSEYARTYHAHELPQRQAFQPPPPRAQVPFDGTSTMKDTYVQHPLESRSAVVPVSQPREGGNFDGTTTYGTNYHSHPIEPRHPAPPPPARAHQPFQGESTYTSQYHAKQPEMRNSAAPQPPPREHVPFDGTSTYGTTYHAHPLPERMAAPQPVQRPHVPFDATTTNHDVFVPHEIQPRMAPPTAAVAKEHIPFDGTTTSKEQFKQWPIEPRTAPPPPPMRPQVPFEGTSTTRDAFQGWKLPPSFPAIGLEIVGDRMHTLIPRGANLPASASHVFSTADDGQREMCVLIYAGDNPKASLNELIGQFDLTGLPSVAKQNLQIEVTFKVDANRVLSVTAKELNSQLQYEWLQNGQMMARTLSKSVQEVHSDQACTMYPAANAGIGGQ